MTQDNNNFKPEDKSIQDLISIPPNGESPTPPTPSIDQETINKLITQRVEQELANIKKKLDDAYTQRDEAVKKATLAEEEKRQKTLQQLEAEGKHKEVYDMKLAELNAKLESYEKQNTELSRDVVVKESLRGLNFRNASAEDMAYREIVGQLTRDEHGRWIHQSGASIKDFVELFSKDEERSFLFKPKTSSGAGVPSHFGDGKAPAYTPGKDSLFKMSQTDVLKMAAEGKIGFKPPII